MTTHVKVLGVLYIALSAIGVATALFLMLAVGVLEPLGVRRHEFGDDRHRGEQQPALERLAGGAERCRTGGVFPAAGGRTAGGGNSM